MYMTAFSLTTLKYSPPTTTILGHFLINEPQISVSVFSPHREMDISAGIHITSPSTEAKKVYKATRKPRRITQLVLVDDRHHAVGSYSDHPTFEVAGSTMQRPVP
jgi:hypothetical protein